MKISFLGRVLAPAAVALGVAVMAAPASAALVVYDFDTLGDLEILDQQYVGLRFTNSSVYRSGAVGGSLNEPEFPPKSGDGVAVDDRGAIGISFSQPVFFVGGYFTYFTRLSFSVFDSADVLLRTVNSRFDANSLLSGDVGSSPNEFLSFDDASGAIARIVIAGDPGGVSFALDDLTVDNGNTVPEPQTLWLTLGLLGAGCLPRGWMRHRSVV